MGTEGDVSAKKKLLVSPQFLPIWPFPQEPLPGLLARDPPWTGTLDPFTMSMVGGPTPLLCLLLLLAPDSPEGTRLPQ